MSLTPVPETPPQAPPRAGGSGGTGSGASLSSPPVPASSPGMAGDPVLLCEMDSVRELAALLHAISFKKVVTVIVSEDGMQFVAEDIQCMQATAHLKRAIFRQYQYNSAQPAVQFDVPANVLLECLHIYGHGSNALVQMRYDGAGPLMLLVQDADTVRTEITLQTSVSDVLTDFEFMRVPVPNKVIIQSDALKDALAELEWSGGSVCVVLSPRAPFFALESEGAHGSCQVQYPSDCDVFFSFECQSELRFVYNIKHVAACLRALQGSGHRPAKTAVRMNTLGVLNLQHMFVFDAAPVFVECLLVPQVAAEHAAADSPQASQASQASHVSQSQSQSHDAMDE